VRDAPSTAFQSPEKTKTALLAAVVVMFRVTAFEAFVLADAPIPAELENRRTLKPQKLDELPPLDIENVKVSAVVAVAAQAATRVKDVAVTSWSGLQVRPVPPVGVSRVVAVSEAIPNATRMSPTAVVMEMVFGEVVLSQADSYSATKVGAATSASLRCSQG
jgi:hypothetical protein